MTKSVFASKLMVVFIRWRSLNRSRTLASLDVRGRVLVGLVLRVVYIERHLWMIGVGVFWYFWVAMCRSSSKKGG